jgi:hypothetical protein
MIQMPWGQNRKAKNKTNQYFAKYAKSKRSSQDS